MLFRPAQLSDKPTLLAMEQALVDAERPFDGDIKDDHCTYYDFDDLIPSDQACVLIIEDEGVAIGTGYVQLRQSKSALQHERHGYMGCMYVAPSHRGQGLITQLIDQLVDWSKAQGVGTFYLDVYHDNASAVRAYEKLGFAPCLLEMKLHR
ncbi:MAG TPA: GNAT family N-acetyltransferase [Oceanospirillaceae bacterium]|nr:GNAT family N-acetyltransferase [Oceanospirillaceae bacterium]